MLKRLSVSVITIYQKYARIVLPFSCRFTPSCSEYARQAIIKYGFFKGILKAGKRLLLCQPFSGKGGYDPLI